MSYNSLFQKIYLDSGGRTNLHEFIFPYFQGKIVCFFGKNRERANLMYPVPPFLGWIFPDGDGWWWSIYHFYSPESGLSAYFIHFWKMSQIFFQNIPKLKRFYIQLKNRLLLYIIIWSFIPKIGIFEKKLKHCLLNT